MSIEIALEEKRLRPGGVVRGRVTLSPEEEGKRIELSVLWETSGKGDTDLGVVMFREIGGTGEHAFEAPLPLLPTSYEGGLIRIDWMVRVRRLQTLAADYVVDESFRVDVVPP